MNVNGGKVITQMNAPVFEDSGGEGRDNVTILFYGWLNRFV